VPSTASVSSTPPSPAFLASSWSSPPCQAGSPCALGAHGEDLVVAHAVDAHHRSRRGGHSACTFRSHRVLYALQSTGSALLARGPCEQIAGPRRAGQARTVRVGRARFRPRSRFKIKIPFLFSFQFQTEFKLQKFVSKYPRLTKL
jgi:hypothetical protein